MPRIILPLQIIIPVLLMCLFGCEGQRSAGQLSKGNEPIAHFPRMVVGDSFVLSGYAAKVGPDIYHIKVIRVESDGSFVCETRGEKEGITRFIRYNNNYQLSRMGYSKENFEKRLDFPLFVGKKWSDKFILRTDEGKYHDHSGDSLVEKYETINTKAGSFKCFKIKRTGYNITAKIYYTEEYWYSPETKWIIKSDPSRRPGVELISYSPGEGDQAEISKARIIIGGEKVKIGILEFQALNEEARRDNFGRVFTEVLTTSFVKSEAFRIIEREQLHTVLKEIELSQSGIIDTSNAAKVGKMVGANAVVVGSVTKISNEMRLDARIIDVESGIILTAEKTEGKADVRNLGLMAETIVANLVNRFYKEKK